MHPVLQSIQRSGQTSGRGEREREVEEPRTGGKFQGFIDSEEKHIRSISLVRSFVFHMAGRNWGVVPGGRPVH